MALVKIVQPSDIIEIIQAGGSFMLKWRPDYASRWNERFSNAQQYVDSEILRLSEPLTPKQTGALIRSGTTGTTIGSGEIRWIAVYAHYQYYGTGLDHSTNLNPNGGAQWFERMKASNLSAILNGIKKYMN